VTGEPIFASSATNIEFTTAEAIKDAATRRSIAATNAFSHHRNLGNAIFSTIFRLRELGILLTVAG
jgi:hypothetical protein